MSVLHFSLCRTASDWNLIGELSRLLQKKEG